MNRYVLIGLLFIVAHAASALTPDELLDTVDRMTPEQVQQFHQKLEAKYWEPVPEGFFRRMAIDVSASYLRLDTVDIDALDLVDRDLDVDEAGGFEVGLLWRILNDQTRLGFRLGGWKVSDDNLSAAGYSRVALSGQHLALVAQYQLLRTEHWLLWTELAPGVGHVRLESVDTPDEAASTLRKLDGDYWDVLLQGGLSWRPNPVLSLFASAGYRFADKQSLDEGGESTDVRIDVSGFTARLGIGLNF